MKKFTLALILIFHTIAHAAEESAYEKLISHALNTMTLPQKQAIVSSYLFEGSGHVDYCLNEGLYKQAWSESGISNEMIFGEALCQDVKIRVFSSLDLKERIWALRVVGFLKQAHLPGDEILPSDQYVNRMIQSLAGQSKPSLPLAVKIVDDLGPELSPSNKLSVSKCSFFDAFRVLFSTSDMGPTIYLEYPYIIVKGNKYRGKQ